MELLPDPHHDAERVDVALKLYLSLLRGLLEEPPADPEAGGAGGDSSKLRHALAYKWSDSVLGPEAAESMKDAVFEGANMAMNVALWHMKHAAMVASKEE